MKIIAGTLRGRNLIGVPKGKYLRPILARIKKSVFDIIRPLLPDADFLDLCAGTGSVGIEALSRGANSVTFIDFDIAAVNTIKKNLENFKISEGFYVYQRDVTFNLKWLKDRGSFDIIFIGPPYRDMMVGKILGSIKEAEILKEKGIVIAQHHKNEKVVDPDGFMVTREEKYGDTIVTFLKQS